MTETTYCEMTNDEKRALANRTMAREELIRLSRDEDRRVSVTALLRLEYARPDELE